MARSTGPGRMCARSGPAHALARHPGGSNSAATATNDLGQIVGYAGTLSGELHAVLWDVGGEMRDLGSLGGPTPRQKTSTLAEISSDSLTRQLAISMRSCGGESMSRAPRLRDDCLGPR